MPILFSILLLSVTAPAFSSTQTAADKEQAKVMVVKHLVALIDSPRLASLIASKTLESENYWAKFFSQSHHPELYSVIKPDLKRALSNIPYVDGARPKPNVFLKIIFRGLKPLPLVTIGEVPSEERKHVVAFSQGPLRKFSSTLYTNERDFDAAIADVALEAGKAFHSSLVTEGFNHLGSMALEVRMKEQELDVIDAKDRLNDLLHLWGIHLVMDGKKLFEGQLNLSAYTIDKKHSYDVLGSEFLMYETQPLVENEYYPALGHAETDQGFLLLFAQTIDEEVDITSRYLNDPAASFLKPSLFVSTGQIQALDALTRDAVSETKDLRKGFIDTVGHHEGFHKYVEPILTTSVDRGLLSEREKEVWHEAGAYLYQLESSDPRFCMLDLMMIVATAAHPSSGIYANTAGARLTMGWLSRVLPELRILDASNELRGEGLLELFKLSPEAVKMAAAKARQRYEVAARNGLRE